MSAMSYIMYGVYLVLPVVVVGNVVSFLRYRKFACVVVLTGFKILSLYLSLRIQTSSMCERFFFRQSVVSDFY